MILKNYSLIGFNKTMSRTEAERLKKKEYNKWYRTTEKGKKSITIGQWKFKGLIWETEDEIDEIYNRYLNSKYCENPKCGKEYKNSKDKCMDHCHTTHKFRNILCNSCNSKIQDNNTSGINGISWDEQSNGWRYKITINGKTHSKYSRDKDYVIKYKEDYENKYLYISEN